MQHLIYNIQRYCIHDGPGIRTILFFKGCPLKCQWCCNPESQSFAPELIYKEITCIKCKACIINCPQKVFKFLNDHLIVEREKCNFCGLCVKGCCTKSLEISGNEINIETIIELILQDRSYFDISDGGVTLSGGEPLAHKDICKEILTQLKHENIHTAVETCGDVDTQTVIELKPYIDLFLFDIKHPDLQAHILGTGKGNETILNNLQILVSLGANIIIRYPFIPGFNSDKATLNKVADLMKNLGLNDIDILPFHRLGSEKYKHLGRTYEMQNLNPPGQDDLLTAKNIFLDKGIKNVTLFN